MIALPGLALARGRGYGKVGPAMSIYGPVYNPVASPEYRLWASNPAAYEQLMMRSQQQYMMKRQQAYMKQMKAQKQQFDKWVKTQKARKDKGLATDPMYDQYLRVQEASGPAFAPDGDPAAGPRRPAARKAATRKGASKNAAAKTAAAKKSEDS